MDLLDRLLDHDTWTTRQFLNLARSLTDEQLDQEHDLGHRTVRRTFDHIIWNLEAWTDLMKGRAMRARPDSSSLDLLAQRHEIASAELKEFARDIDDRQCLDETFLDQGQRKTFGGTFVHLATHGMHHRAQLLIMFRLLGMKDLPEGDALTWEQTLKVERNPEDPTTAEMAFVDAQLEKFNAEMIRPFESEPLNLVIREGGEVVAGLKAITGWEWLYIQVLWVHASHRQKGLGSRLLLQAEDEAKKRGCLGSCLSSFTFQAPQFYIRHGYSTFGQIDEYPPGSTMYFFSKRFETES